MSSPTSTTSLTEDRRRELLAEREQVAQRTIKLPDVVSFDELFDVIAFWDHSRFKHIDGKRSPEYPDGAFVTVTEALPPFGKKAVDRQIEIGPFCSVERQQTRGHYGLAVTPKAFVLEELRGWIMGDPNESWSFEIIDHGEVALVIASNNLSIGGVWLAYIDPSTIPDAASFVHAAAPFAPSSEPTGISKAERVGVAKCYVCGQRIKRVPGGQGPTWVHEDTGAVAAANPPGVRS